MQFPKPDFGRKKNWKKILAQAVTNSTFISPVKRPSPPILVTSYDHFL